MNPHAIHRPAPRDPSRNTISSRSNPNPESRFSRLLLSRRRWRNEEGRTIHSWIDRCESGTDLATFRFGSCSTSTRAVLGVAWAVSPLPLGPRRWTGRDPSLLFETKE